MPEGTLSIKVVGKIGQFVKHANSNLTCNELYRQKMVDKDSKITNINSYNEDEYGEIIINNVQGMDIQWSSYEGKPLKWCVVYLRYGEYLMFNLEGIEAYLENVTHYNDFGTHTYDRLTLVHFNMQNLAQQIDYKEDKNRYVFKLKAQTKIRHDSIFAKIKRRIK